MTGTSVDCLDLALIERMDALDVEITHARSVEFPEELRAAILRLINPDYNNIDKLGRTSAWLGTFIGESILELLQDLGLNPKDVDAIGSHGQTIRHHPWGKHGYTMQIGDPSRIVAITNIDTMSDFRSADIAVGGEGAPLVPAFHQEIFGDNQEPRIVLNIGGISNITYLPADESSDILGFDTGPGNALIDAWVQHRFNKAFDPDGVFAEAGTCNQELLKQLHTEPWLQKSPPKSSGKELFNLRFVKQAIEASGVQLSVPDVLSTLVEFTVTTIADAVHRWCPPAHDLVVCGGGRWNEFMMQRLTAQLPNLIVNKCEDHHVNGDAIEAATFAYLAYLFDLQATGNLPSVTGARTPRVLGCRYISTP